MGVHGLWKLIEPSGQMVPLESLAGKVLAVDVSIWLHQAIKGMHDTQGAPVAVAHLLILFHRLCKLLFYKIKPVFVFDGGVPTLKRQTMAARRQQSSIAKSEAMKVREKLIKNLLKHEAVRQVLSSETASVVLGLNSFALPGPSVEEELYKLPPIAADYANSESSENLSSGEEEAEDYVEDIHSIDVTSKEFLSLPPEVRHDILTELIDTRKQSSWKNLDSMPKQSDSFSDFQMNRLLKRRAVQSSLEEAGKEMGGKALSLKELESLLGDQGVLDPQMNLPGRRIAKDNVTRYVLVQKDSSEQNNIMDRLEDVGWSSESDTDVILGKKSEARVKKIESPVKITKQETLLSRQPKVRVTEEIANILSVLEDENAETEIKVKIEGLQNKVVLIEPDEIKKEMADCSQNVLNDLMNDLVDKTEDVRDIKTETESASTFEGKERTEDKSFLVRKQTPHESSISTDENLQSVKKSEEQSRVEDFVKKINDNALEIKSELLEEKSKIPEVSVDEEKITIEIKNLQSVTSKSLEQTRVAEDIKKTNIDASEIKSEPPEEKSKIPEISADEEKIAIEIDNPQGVEQERVSEDVKKINDETMSEPLQEKTENGDQNTTDSSDVEDFVLVNEESPFEYGNTKEETDQGPKTFDPMTVTINASDSAAKDDIFADVFEPNRGNDDAKASKHSTDDISRTDKDTINEYRTEFEKPKTKEEFSFLKKSLEEEQLDLLREKGKQERHAVTPTEQMYSDAQELLRMFGVPFIVAPMEAEAQCATLNLIGLTEGTITDDSDIWLFGARVVYKNFFNQNKHVLEYRSDDIQKYFKLSRKDMIKMALLVGSDYTVGLNGVGPVTALEILANFQSQSENLLDGLQKFRDWFSGKTKCGPARVSLKKKMKNTVLSPGFPNQAVADAYLNPKVDDSKEPFSWAKPNIELIRKYTKSKLGWSPEKCNDLLIPVLKRMEENANQFTMDKYFRIVQKTCLAEGSVSKRVENAIKRLGGDAPEEGEGDSEPKPKKLRKLREPRTKRCKDSESSVEETGVNSNKNVTKKENDAEVQTSFTKESKTRLINQRLHQEVVVPQKEMSKKMSEERRKKAIEIFRTYKKGKKSKVKVYAKEQVKLSESSDSD